MWGLRAGAVFHHVHKESPMNEGVRKLSHENICWKKTSGSGHKSGVWESTQGWNLRLV